MALDPIVGQRLAAEAARELADADAQAIVKWADSTLEGRIVVTTSLRDAVVIDLAARVRPDVDVVFVDTGYHLPETLGLRDAVDARYPVQMVTAEPSRTVDEQAAVYGPELHRRDPDRCCQLRKVAPLNAMISRYDGWVTGLRRIESPARAGAQKVEWDRRRRVVKVNPIADWTDDDVDAYVAEHDVLVNPLVAQGYPSIGCAPCTSPVVGDDDPRAGRWPGTSKSECGIHL